MVDEIVLHIWHDLSICEMLWVCDCSCKISHSLPQFTHRRTHWSMYIETEEGTSGTLYGIHIEWCDLHIKPLPNHWVFAHSLESSLKSFHVIHWPQLQHRICTLCWLVQLWVCVFPFFLSPHFLCIDILILHCTRARYAIKEHFKFQPCDNDFMYQNATVVAS